VSVSVPPPGWVAPARSVASSGAAAGGASDAADLRREDRRALDGKRVRARFVDALILAPLTAPAYVAWGLNLGTIALSQCLTLILHHLCETTTGATPGKRWLGLRVARLEDGGLPSPREAAARGVIGIIDVGPIGLISIICTRQRQRLGDLAAGTVVVDARRHPVARRALLAGAIAYPVVWAIPALVACVLAARGDVPGTYRHDADQACAAQTRALRGFAPLAVGAVTRADLAAAQVDQAAYDAVRQLDAPAAWAGRRDDLLRRMLTRIQARHAMVVDLQLHPGGATRATWTARLRAEVADDDAALAAEGFHGCAHRA